MILLNIHVHTSTKGSDQFNTTCMIIITMFYLYYLPGLPVGLGVTVVDDVSVGKGIREDEVLDEGRPAIQKSHFKDMMYLNTICKSILLIMLK